MFLYPHVSGFDMVSLKVMQQYNTLLEVPLLHFKSHIIFQGVSSPQGPERFPVNTSSTQVGLHHISWNITLSFSESYKPQVVRLVKLNDKGYKKETLLSLLHDGRCSKHSFELDTEYQPTNGVTLAAQTQIVCYLYCSAHHLHIVVNSRFNCSDILR